MTRIVYVNGRYCRTPKPPSTWKTAAFNSPTLSMRSARCATAGSSMSPAIWPGSRARLPRSRSSANERRGAGPRDARNHPPQPRAAWPRLPAGDARGRPARVRLSGPDVPRTVVCLARSLSTATQKSRSGSGHCRQDDARHPLAPLRHQDGDAAAGRASPRRRPSAMARARPGSSTTTDSSPRVRRATPGSSPTTALSSLGKSTRLFSPVSRGRR